MEDKLDKDALLKLTSTQDKRDFGIVKREKLKHRLVILRIKKSIRNST
jgi:hypothetical protein